MQATIDPNGKVTKAEILGGHRLLTDAALDAVKQWKFEPEKNVTDRITEVILRFTLMPRCSDKRSHTPIFHFPYTAEIRQEKVWMSCDDCSPEREKELNCGNP
jgi:TonB family protein